LQINNLGDSRARKDMMVTANSLTKLQRTKQIAQIIEVDIRV